MSRIIVLLVAFGAAVAANAQPRVVDLRTGVEDRFGAGEWLEVDGRVLYLTDDGRGTGSELFHFDLDAERIERIATLCPQRDRDDVEILWRGSRHLLFSDFCINGGPSQTWTTDGTKEGTRPLFPVGGVQVLGAVAEDRVVVAVSPFLGSQVEVWLTDGTEAGSRLLLEGFSAHQFGARLASQEPPELPWVVFEAEHPTFGRGLFRSDGTPEGTRRVEIPVPGSQRFDVVQIGRVGAKYWFTTVTPGMVGVWVTDGTAAGSVRVIEGLEQGPDLTREVLFVAGTSKTFFWLETDDGFPRFRRADLWVTDGTAAGSHRLTRNREAEEAGEIGRELGVWRDTVYFYFRPNSSTAPRLWQSAGTVDSTSSLPIERADFGTPFRRSAFGLLLVGVAMSNAQPSLWIVDDADPVPRSIQQGSWNLDLPGTAKFQYLTTLHFSTSLLPDDLWITDGTTAGTRELRDDGIFYFSDFLGFANGKGIWWHWPGAFDGPPTPLELWLTEGTATTTRRLELEGLTREVDANPRELAALGERVAFVLDDPSGDDDPYDQAFPERLFASDGTPAGTLDLVDFPPGLPVPLRLLTLLTPIPGGRVLFHVDDQLAAHPDLAGFWSANGQPGGTFKLSAPGEYRGRDRDDFWPTADGALVASRFVGGEATVEGLFRLFVDGRPPLAVFQGPTGFTVGARFLLVGSTLHLLADGRLIKADGTPEGTSVAIAGVGSPVPFQGRILYLNSERQVWAYDGQSPPSPFEFDLGPLVGRAAVASGPGIFGGEFGRLWYFDGSRTTEIAGFRQIRSWAPFRGGLAFVAEAEWRDAELWFSDGTTAGTRRIADLWPGPLGSYPGDLKVVGDRLFFTAHDGTHGRELWSTDGTAAGTVMYDVNAGIGSSTPAELTVAGRKLFFSAYDDTHGREPWSLDLGDGEGPLPPSGAWLSSPAIPGFRFQVRIAESTVGRLEPACLQETACISGAVAGRPEVFLRVVGPRGNGFLWPTLIKFTTSEAEIWLEQTATGVVKYYSLAGAGPGVDELPARFDRLGFRPESAVGPAIVPGPTAAVAPEHLSLPAAGPPPPPGTTFFESPAMPGFRVAARITAGETVPPVRREAACIAETLCLSGAVPGRSEVFVRVVGPKPNGFLWPTLVRFTSSQVEVWIEQKATGLRQYYLLPGASADSDDLTGLFHRAGFEP